MDSTAESHYISLVVRLEEAADGHWYVVLDGPRRPKPFLLKPATFVFRLRRVQSSGVLRGTIALHNTDQSAPFQSNVQLEQLVLTWLQATGTTDE